MLCWTNANIDAKSKCWHSGRKCTKRLPPHKEHTPNNSSTRRRDDLGREQLTLFHESAITDIRLLPIRTIIYVYLRGAIDQKHQYYWLNYASYCRKIDISRATDSCSFPLKNYQQLDQKFLQFVYLPYEVSKTTIIESASKQGPPKASWARK